MKKTLIGIAAIAALIATPALAADMALKAPPPVVAVYNWTGFYVGGNVGYSWGEAHSTYDDPNFAPLQTTFTASQKLDGIIGGGQVGYNWQANKTWVLGLEADIQGADEKGRFSFSDPYSVGVDCDIYCSTVGGTVTSAIDWFGTLRGRAGVLVNPTTLLYGTGGLAYAGVKTSGTVTDAGCAGPPACTVGHITPPVSWAFGESTTKVGWTVGAGIEGAFSNSKNWTWKVEYLYLDFGSISGSGFETFADFGPLPYTWSSRFTDNVLRVGVNYNFH